jgi:hypothetical protein
MANPIGAKANYTRYLPGFHCANSSLANFGRFFRGFGPADFAWLFASGSIGFRLRDQGQSGGGSVRPFAFQAFQADT